MAENHGLDVDDGLHPRLLTLTDGSLTYIRVLLTMELPKINKLSLTIQGQKNSLHPWYGQS
jgi:hypothetical protein